MKNKIKIYLLCALITLIASHGRCFAEIYPWSEAAQEAEVVDEADRYMLYQRHIHKGNKYVEDIEFGKAEEEFKEAIRLMPEMPEGYLNLATIAIQKKRFAGARKLLAKARSLITDTYPKKDILFYNMALCAQKQKKYETALYWYEKAFAANSNFGEARYNSGLCLKEIRRDDDAYQAFKAARDIFKQNNQQPYIIKADEALISLEQTSRTDTKRLAKKLLEEGSTHFKANDFEKAKNLFEDCLRIDPDYAEAHYRLGTVYATKGDFQAALDHFNTTIALDPRHSKAYINLGSVYGNLKNYQAARDAYLKALELDHNNPTIYHNIGTEIGRAHV